MEETTAPAVEVPRGLRIARLALIPLAAILVAVLLFGRGGDAVGKPVSAKRGVTTQGRAFTLGLDSHGRPAAFSTAILARCPDGHMIGLPWDPVAVDGVRFDRRGDALHVEESGDGWKQTLDGTQSGDGSMRGSMSLVVHITPKSKPAYDCRSPRVRFFAGR